MQTGIKSRGDKFLWVWQKDNCFFYGYENTWDEAHFALKQAMSDSKRAENCTVDECFSNFIENKQGVRETTLLKYRQVYHSFIRESIGNMRMRNITVETLETLFEAIVYSGTSPITTGMVRSLLSNLFKMALKERIIDTDPMPMVEIPRNKKEVQKRTPFTEEELQELIGRIHRTDLRTIIQLGAWTGMRAGEILGLQREDIDFKNELIRVRHTLSVVQRRLILEEPKTMAGRRAVPVSRECLVMLKEYMDSDFAEIRRNLAPTDYKNFVFLSSKGLPIPGTCVANHLKMIVTKMKADGVLPSYGNYTFHSLRHTFATKCLLKGMKPKVLATILGHSSTRVTLEIYTHICEDDEKNEMRRIGLI